jgi:hypothetical protein
MAVPRSDASLPALVASSFARTPDQFSDEFLRELRSNWREALSRSRRSVLQVLFLGILFILLASADISEIAFVGVKLTPQAVDLIATGIPAVIAYLFSLYWEFSVLAERYEEVHDEIYKQLHPGAASLAVALHPPDANEAGSLMTVMLGKKGRGGKMLGWTSIFYLLTTYLMPFIVIVGLYVLLILDFNPNCYVYGISFFLSGFFVVRTIGFMQIDDVVNSSNETEDPSLSSASSS